MAISTNCTNRLVIFTDLDGTLLDPFTYSYAVARPLVTRLRKKKIPIIFCSSKTRAEQEVLRRKLGIGDPFIVEDGGAIFIKRGYFPFLYEYQRVVRNYHVIEPGITYREIRGKLQEISRKYNLAIQGFGDMATTDVANLTGLDMESAKLAKKREYEETLNLEDNMPETEFILKKIEEAGLTWHRGGRFYSVSGGSDKGKATKIVIKLFERKLGNIKAVGIGDGLNDMAMLAEVDFPVLVQKPGNYWEEIALPNLYRVRGIGPQGWVQAIEELLVGVPSPKLTKQ